MKTAVMKNHKWKDTSSQFNPKMETCTKCGIERSWLGGNMQCWEYMDLRLSMEHNRTSLYRPNCIPNLPLGITSLSRKGNYI